VTIAHRSDAFRARPDFRARVAENAKIEVVPYATVTAIEGGSRVERVRLAIEGTPRTIDVTGVFVCAGVEPRSELVRGQLALDDRGYVEVDATLRTSISTCYAAGDVRAGSSWTVAGAVGDGAMAIKDIQRRLAS
jgi:thioredoxin reductase (NADPH)